MTRFSIDSAYLPLTDGMTGRPLRILVAHNVPQSRNGGMSRMMGFIHDQLVREGHTVDYFCSENVPHALNGRLQRFSFPIMLFLHVLSRTKSGEQYDVINVHEPSAAALVLGRKVLGKTNIVVTSYGVELRWWKLRLQERRVGRQGPNLKSRIVYPSTSLWQSSVGFRFTDHVFCQNSEDRDFLINRFNLSRSKITLIFAGASEVYACAAKGRDYNRARRLIFAGTWIKRKGIEDLVPAFTTLARRHPRLALTALGTGAPETSVLEPFPGDVRPRVQWMRTTTDAENATAFAAADIYVLPTLFDGGPLTSVEAMMSGLPVVTTPMGLMKDAIRDGENGILVPMRSPQAIVAAVEKLLDDAALRAKVGRAAQRDALEKYTWERIAASVRDVYKRFSQATA